MCGHIFCIQESSIRPREGKKWLEAEVRTVRSLALGPFASAHQRSCFRYTATYMSIFSFVPMLLDISKTAVKRELRHGAGAAGGSSWFSRVVERKRWCHSHVPHFAELGVIGCRRV
jgi:hypothetical protein